MNKGRPRGAGRKAFSFAAEGEKSGQISSPKEEPALSFRKNPRQNCLEATVR